MPFEIDRDGTAGSVEDHAGGGPSLLGMKSLAGLQVHHRLAEVGGEGLSIALVEPGPAGPANEALPEGAVSVHHGLIPSHDSGLWN